ncbi:tryptophan-rich sensory protein [Patescibacteria group bacterium]|nr:tryptophan-rich sensory protein [Patescibacteria group bacterium]
MNYTNTYVNYLLPSRAPPGRLFGPVWTILYIIIAISYSHVLMQVIQKKLPAWILIPFVINLLSNFLFTYLWFSKASLLLGWIDILIVFVTILITIALMRSRIRRVAYAQLPYLAWVTFASILATRIFIHN